MRLMRAAQRVGKGVVPGALVVDGVSLWIAGRQRLDQRAFRRGDAAGQREGSAGRVMGAGKRRRLTGDAGLTAERFFDRRRSAARHASILETARRMSVSYTSGG